MMRSVLACVLLTTTVAHAEGELPNGAMLRWNRVFITEDGQVKEPSTIEVRRRYLNLAHCVCAASDEGPETTISYDLTLSATTNTARPGEIWVGTQCDNDQQRPMTCMAVDQINNIDLLAQREERIDLNLFDVINGTDTMGCREEDGGTANVWFLVDTDANATYDFFSTQSVGNTSTTPMNEQVSFDTKAPPLPTGFEASAAENGISLSWTVPEATADIEYYQALCAKQDGSPAKAAPDEAQYQTVRSLCGLEQDITLAEAAVEGGDEGMAMIPAAMKQLDPAYVCGTIAEPTASGMLIEGLDNDVPYSVIVLAIDRNGNASGVYLTKTVTPRPATDLWEDLHERGSGVEGGFCGAGTGAAGPLGGLLVAIAGILARGRRRSARRLAAGIAAGIGAVAFLVPTQAFAQATPYWEDDAPTSYEDNDDVTWHAGLRLGPYVPDIDAQFEGTGSPYAEMFGGYQILPMIDVDRILWRGFGQLGVGGTIGYMQKSAKAWQDGSTPGDPMRPRSEGDDTTFRLIPAAVTAVYRLTVLDDNWGIPLVPYARGGLSYYVWWFRTNGRTSRTEAGDKARGGTLGVQGAIGLSIRAERVDSDAASSMRASGIHHAGFYAELSLAKVDGFGSDSKLSVGDATWFAGVDFEF